MLKILIAGVVVYIIVVTVRLGLTLYPEQVSYTVATFKEALAFASPKPGRPPRLQPITVQEPRAETPQPPRMLPASQRSLRRPPVPNNGFSVEVIDANQKQVLPARGSPSVTVSIRETEPPPEVPEVDSRPGHN